MELAQWAEVFGQPRDGFAAAGVVLNAVNAGENASRGATLPPGNQETGDGIETDGRRGFPFVDESNLEAILETRADDAKTRMLGSKALESFEARGDSSFLPLHGSLVRQTGRIGEIARSATRSGGKARV